jgi:hypothetical protein
MAGNTAATIIDHSAREIYEPNSEQVARVV